MAKYCTAERRLQSMMRTFDSPPKRPMNDQTCPKAALSMLLMKLRFRCWDEVRSDFILPLRRIWLFLPTRLALKVEWRDDVSLFQPLLLLTFYHSVRAGFLITVYGYRF